MVAPKQESTPSTSTPTGLVVCSPQASGLSKALEKGLAAASQTLYQPRSRGYKRAGKKLLEQNIPTGHSGTGEQAGSTKVRAYPLHCCAFVVVMGS
jgi:hypothetical protein